ncbi:hypothetical protein Tco_0780826 [Tanacetum coccineum]
MSTEARSSCLPYKNDLRQGESSGLEALLVGRIERRLQTAEENRYDPIISAIQVPSRVGSRKDGDEDTTFY